MSKLQNAAMSKCSNMKCSNDKEETPGKVSLASYIAKQDHCSKTSQSLWEQDHSMESPPIWQQKCYNVLMFCPQYNMEWPSIWQTECSNVSMFQCFVPSTIWNHIPFDKWNVPMFKEMSLCYMSCSACLISGNLSTVCPKSVKAFKCLIECSDVQEEERG